MINPVPSSVECQRKPCETLFVRYFVQLQQHREAGSSKNRVSIIEGNVVAEVVSNI